MKFWATATRMDPTVNKISGRMIRYLCPNVFDSDPKVNWKTVLVSKNEVPAQNASMAETAKSCIEAATGPELRHVHSPGGVVMADDSAVPIMHPRWQIGGSLSIRTQKERVVANSRWQSSQP